MTPENLALLKRHFNYLPQAEFDALVKMMDEEAEKWALQEVVNNKLASIANEGKKEQP